MRAISHGRRFWPITLTRLTGIYPERECAHYRFHTVADILDLLTILRSHEPFLIFYLKKNDTSWIRRGYIRVCIKCNSYWWGIFLLGIWDWSCVFFERFSLKNAKLSIYRIRRINLGSPVTRNKIYRFMTRDWRWLIRDLEKMKRKNFLSNVVENSIVLDLTSIN